MQSPTFAAWVSSQFKMNGACRKPPGANALLSQKSVKGMEMLGKLRFLVISSATLQSYGLSTGTNGSKWFASRNDMSIQIN